MIEFYQERQPLPKRALQLTPETVEEMCRWTCGYVLDESRWVPQESCWRVSAQRWYPVKDWFHTRRTARLVAAMHGRQALLVGIRTRQGEQVVTEGQWVVQGRGGAFEIVPDGQFNDRYQRVPEAVAK